MIVGGPLFAVGLAAGYWVRRWLFVAALTLIGLATSLSGWLTGWAASPDTPATGGALLLAVFGWIPLSLGAALGVYLRRTKQRRNRPR